MENYYKKKGISFKIIIDNAPGHLQNIVDFHPWNDVQNTDMNGVWKKLCPKFVNDFKGFDNVEINKTLVTMSKELEDFIDLFNKGQAAPDKDLIELNKQEKKKKEVKLEPCHSSLKKMQEVFAFIEKGLQIFEDIDQMVNTFQKLCTLVTELLLLYHVILEEHNSRNS